MYVILEGPIEKGLGKVGMHCGKFSHQLHHRKMLYETWLSITYLLVQIQYESESAS